VSLSTRFLLAAALVASSAPALAAESFHKTAAGVLIFPDHGQAKAVRLEVYGDAAVRVTESPARTIDAPQSLMVTARPGGAFTVAQQAGRPMAQVALNWLHHKRGVASIIVGATKPEQLRDSLAALDFTLDPALVARLDAVSEPARPFPYYMFEDGHQARIHGHVDVRNQPDAYDRPVHVPAPQANA